MEGDRVNQAEVVKVVARIQAGDNRTVDEVTVAHWTEMIGHLRFEDALEAVVTHFRESTAYLMPAHVIASARRIAELKAIGEATEYCRAHAWYPVPCVRCAEQLAGAA
jgi:hypothetical protein